MKRGSFNSSFSNSSFDANHKTKDCFPFEENPCNPRFPHKVKISRPITSNGNPFEDDSDDKEEVLYVGACRSYKRGSTTDRDNVLYNQRCISIFGAVLGLKINDVIEVCKYGYEEKGYVRDVNIYMAGRGTVIEWGYERV